MNFLKLMLSNLTDHTSIHGQVWREMLVPSCLRMLIPALHPILDLPISPAIWFPSWMSSPTPKHPSRKSCIHPRLFFHSPFLIAHQVLIPPKCFSNVSSHHNWNPSHLYIPPTAFYFQSHHLFLYSPQCYIILLCTFPSLLLSFLRKLIGSKGAFFSISVILSFWHPLLPSCL